MTAGPAAADAALRMGSARGRWVLLTTVLGSGLAMLDATVVNVALGRIGEDLGAGFAGLQWTINAYTLTLAALILLAGAAGDRYGRRLRCAGDRGRQRAYRYQCWGLGACARQQRRRPTHDRSIV